MSYELFIARRLRLATDSRHRASASIVIAIAGIALSVVVMMAAMCIVLGFKDEIRNKVYGFDAHVTVHPANPDGSPAEFIDLTPTLDSLIESTGCFDRPMLTLTRSAVLKTDSSFQAVVVKGIDDGFTSRFIGDNIVAGALPDFGGNDGGNTIVISRATANALDLNVGDKTFAYFFTGGSVKTRRLEIAAVYDTHFSDYDKLNAYCALALAQSISGVGDSVGTSVELVATDPETINDSGIKLQDAMLTAAYKGELTGAYTLSSVLDTAIMYFNWLELLDTNVVVILILMMAVAGFTLVSSLFIIILERVRMIGLLKALGATDREIRRVFIFMAQRIVVLGLLAGNFLGLLILLSQWRFHYLPLDPEAYYLNFVPVKIDWLYIALLNAGAFILSWLIIILPSHIVAKIDPCKSLKYE